MAAELVGTAYVRIRAITAGLASEIKDGVEKGAADADLDKAGKGLGEDLGESTSKSFKGAMGDGVADALDAPEVHKAAEEGGHGVAKDVTKGIDDETKRRNPFAALADRLKDVDLGRPLIPQIDSMRKDLGKAFDNIGVDIDFGGPRLDREAEATGRKTAQSMKKGVDDENKKNSPFDSFTKALQNLPFTSKPFNWIGIFGPTTLAPIIGGIVSMIGLVVQALGFVVLAAAGAGVALAGIAAVALPGFAALFAAFKTQTKQLEKFKETAKKLLKPWEQFGAATQEFLLPGIEAMLEAIQLLIPQFVAFGREIGRIFGDMATFAGHILTTERNTRALGTVLDSSTKFFTNVRTAVLNLVEALMPFLAAVAPLAVKFSESIAKWATGLNAFLKEGIQIDNMGVATGTLVDKFQSWYDKFVLLAGILGDVAAGLWGILSIAGETGTPFFDKIGEAAQKFRDWVTSAEGQNKIKQFFDNIQPVLDEVWRLLGNLINLIVAPAVSGDGGAVMFERLAGALDLLNDVLENPVTQTVVPYLLGLFVALQLLKTAGQTAEAINKFADSMKALSGVLSSMASVPGTLMAFLTTGTFGPIIAVLGAVAIAAGLVYLAFQHWDDWVMPVLRRAKEIFDELSLPLKIIVGALGLFLAVMNPVVWAVAIAGVLKNWDAIWEKLTEIGTAIKEFVGFENLKEQFIDFASAIPGALQDALDAIVEFVIDLPEKLAPIGDAIAEFVTGLPDKLRSLGDAIVGAIGDVPGRIKEALLTGLENLPGLMLTALGNLFEVGQNLLGLIADGLMYALPKFLEFFAGMPGRIIRFLTAVLPEILSIGIQIIGFILKGLASALPRVFFFFLRLPVEIATLLRKGITELIKLGVEMIVALAKGIFREKGRIFDFFKELPGNLLSMLLTAIDFLFDLGVKIITALYNGIVGNVGALFSWFVALPGTIIGLLGDVLSILWDAGGNLISGLISGATAFLGSLDEFFGGLPQKIFDFVSAGLQILIDLGGKIPGWILEGVTALAQTLWDWFTGLPQAILDTLTGISQTIIDIGGSIVGWIVDGIKGLWSLFSDWVAEFPENFMLAFDFYKDKILDIGEAIIGWIVDGLKAVWNLISDWVSEFPENFMLAFDFYKDKVLDIGEAIIGWVVDGFKAAFEVGGDIIGFIADLPGNFLDVLKDASDAWIDIGGDIIGWIVEGFEGIGDALWKALKTAWNWVADKFKITIPIPFAEDITISAPHLAMGGIIPGSAFGVPIVAGEGYRAEAVIPMTRPARALALMQEAGLDKLVLDAVGGGGSVTGRTATGETTMLHIDNAVMTSPVDVDMVAQRITAAYNRMAS